MNLLIRLMLLAAMLLPMSAEAQGQFSPAITVNDTAITPYEIEQRALLLKLFGTTGDLQKAARDSLIEDSLKDEALTRANLILDAENLGRALDEFATRTNMPYDAFVGVLSQNGIAEGTLRDYVRINAAWREYIRSRYLGRVSITEAQIDRALGQTNSGAAIEVLISEIIIAAPAGFEAQAASRAEAISRIRTTAEFEAQAQLVSAVPSRENGGQLDWLPITNFPPQMRGLILSLTPGEVTEPIQIDGGIVLFQMRAVREIAQAKPAASLVDYMEYRIPGGASAVGKAQDIEELADTCNDLYGIAKGASEQELIRHTATPAQIPTDVAVELAKLDPGEASYGLTRDDGQTLLFLMLCSRSVQVDAEVDRDAVRNQLIGQQLNGYAAALIAELRAAATIVGE
ncbi:MAG: peptidylprolyl isomerase [Rhodobacteraceae bacterium]|nr:peptidylprolyl isomerase [Paracoccaceae bacterium]